MLNRLMNGLFNPGARPPIQRTRDRRSGVIPLVNASDHSAFPRQARRLSDREPFDFEMRVTLADKSGRYPCTGYWHDVTFGPAALIAEALGFGIVEIDGKSAIGTAPLIYEAIVHLREHPRFYTAFDPASKGRNVAGALSFLGRLLTGCTQRPVATLFVEGTF